MSDPQRQQVRVRRSPRIGVFLVLGAALGVVVALVFITVSPSDPQVPAPQAFGFIALLLAPVGALISGAVAVAIDRMAERRSRIVDAELIGSEQDPERDAPPADQGVRGA